MMTKQEAIKAMQEGHKVAHRFFSDEEWMRITDKGLFEFEDGIVCNPLSFWAYRDGKYWEDGWSLYKESTN